MSQKLKQEVNMKSLILYAFAISFLFSNSLIQKQIDGMKRFSGTQQQPKKEQEIKPPKQETPKTQTIINPTIHATPAPKPQKRPLYEPNNLITRKGLEKMAKSFGCSFIHETTPYTPNDGYKGNAQGFYRHYDGIPGIEIRGGKKPQEKQFGAYCVISAVKNWRYKEIMIHEMIHHIDLKLLGNDKNEAYCDHSKKHWERECEKTAEFATLAIETNDLSAFKHPHHKKVANEFIRIYKQVNGIK